MESKRVSSSSTSEQPSKLRKTGVSKANRSMSEADDFDVDSGNPFNEPRCGSDVALVVEGKKLHVHKSVLSVHSPVFRTMFTSNFSEKDATEVKLPEKKYEAMINFLLHMYPVHSLKDIKSGDVLSAVLALAHEYQAKHVLLNCSAYIERQIPYLKYKPAGEPQSSLTMRTQQYSCLGGYEPMVLPEEVRALHFLYLCEKYDFNEPFHGVLHEAATFPIDTIEENEHFKMLTIPTQMKLLVARCQVAEGLIRK